jgi:hypothetical protein
MHNWATDVAWTFRKEITKKALKYNSLLDMKVKNHALWQQNKMTEASHRHVNSDKHSSRLLNQQNPLTILCGRPPKNYKLKKLHHLGHHKELAQEAMSKKHMFRWTPSRRFLATSFRKWTQRGRTYPTTRGPLPTRTSIQSSQNSWSTRSHRQPKP